jgi:hypothetical protein
VKIEGEGQVTGSFARRGGRGTGDGRLAAGGH